MRALPTLLVKPTSFPYQIAATATPPAQRLTTNTGPSTVGRIEPLKTRMSGNQDILDSYIRQRFLSERTDEDARVACGLRHLEGLKALKGFRLMTISGQVSLVSD